MIDKIGLNHIIPGGCKTPQGNGSAQAKEVKSSAAVEVNCASMMDRVMNSEEINKAAVERAKQMLASGELDSPAIIRQTAQTILDLGI